MIDGCFFISSGVFCGPLRGPLCLAGFQKGSDVELPNQPKFVPLCGGPMFSIVIAYLHTKFDGFMGGMLVHIPYMEHVGYLRLSL